MKSIKVKAKKNVMKKILPIFILYLTLESCVGNFHPDEPVMPTPNENELIFKDSLEKNGYSNIRFEIPYVGLSPYGQSSYYLKLDFPVLTNNYDIDSLKNINRKIAFNLYSNAITDSIMYDLESLSVIFILKNKNKKGYSSINKSYSKKMLIDSTGIRIIKSNTKYKRINIY